MKCSRFTFNPLLRFSNIGLGLVQLLIVTLLAVAYPLLIAQKIVPLQAMQRD